uniref:Sodium-coupled neutral amino acid transporter 3-like n=1 Tax=Phallusia mammillata TaxID=59560 RepID=A0A6F9DS31_9ASCI|nr:sodium-coupled neutral amino acid transporter 3-like [Phallusia mammillata]
MKTNTQEWSNLESTADDPPFFAYLQCFFISIATILGTGILGLPLMLSNCGFYPFVVTFTISYLMQMLVVTLMVEVLQISQSAISNSIHEFLGGNHENQEFFPLRQHNSVHSADHEALVPIGQTDFTCEDSSAGSDDDGEDIGESIIGGPNKSVEEMHPNLHLMGKLFLPNWMGYVFSIILFLNFTSTLISYVLAGSESYGQLLSINYVKVIPVFMWTLTIFILLAFQFLQPVIALMTLAKGSILIVTIMVTCYVSIEIHTPISNNWLKLNEPFLMEAVALGGLPLVMPMLFGRFSAKEAHVKGFRASIFAGLTVCMLLNIAWCWAVLSVVPQIESNCNGTIGVASLIGNQSSVLHGDEVTTATVPVTTAPVGASELVKCDPAMSLQGAKENGLISTVPLTQFIKKYRPDFDWIATLLQLFIMISVTVSYLTIGSAMQHTVIGAVDYIIRSRRKCKLVNILPTFCAPNALWHIGFGVLAFLVVFLVALSDPKGFVNILDKIVSCTVNLICGPLLFLMLVKGRSRTFRHLVIPLQTHPNIRKWHYVLPIFFGGAILYELVSGIINAILVTS